MLGARKSPRSRQGGFVLVGKGRAMLGGVDKDAAALIAQMPVKPSSQRQFLISNTIKSLKSAGVWSKLDALYMTAAHDSQAALLNWKAPGTWSLVATNSPTFTTDRGFKGDGATSYLQASGYNPSTAGGNFSLNDAILGAWIRQVGTIANSSLVRGSSQAFFTLNTGPTTVQARLNDTATLNYSPVSLTAGHYVANRPDAVGKELWKDGALWTAKDASAPVALPQNLFILCFNSTSSFSDGEISCAYMGSSFTDAQKVASHAAFSAYMKGVGAA